MLDDPSHAAAREPTTEQSDAVWLFLPGASHDHHDRLAKWLATREAAAFHAGFEACRERAVAAALVEEEAASAASFRSQKNEYINDGAWEAARRIGADIRALSAEQT